MKRLVKLSFFSLLLLQVTSDSSAAVLKIEPVLAGFFDANTFEPIDTGGLSTVPENYGFGSPVVVQMDVYLTVLSLDPGEDSFGLAAFSFDFETCLCSVKNNTAIWVPNDPIIDRNGPLPDGIVPLFALNADIGGDPMDLKGILVQFGTGAFTDPVDPRRNLGEAGSPLGVPFLLGSGLFDWTNRGEVIVTLDPLEVAVKQTNGGFVPATAITTGAPVGLLCPEPTSLVLIIGSAGGGFLRRRAGRTS